MRLTALIAALLVTGCTLDSAYVAGDRLTYDALAPAHQAYVEADESLDSDQKDRRLSLLRSWEARVLEGEDRVGE